VKAGDRTRRPKTTTTTKRPDTVTVDYDYDYDVKAGDRTRRPKTTTTTKRPDTVTVDYEYDYDVKAGDRTRRPKTTTTTKRPDLVTVDYEYDYDVKAGDRTRRPKTTTTTKRPDSVTVDYEYDYDVKAGDRTRRPKVTTTKKPETVTVDDYDYDVKAGDRTRGTTTTTTATTTTTTTARYVTDAAEEIVVISTTERPAVAVVPTCTTKDGTIKQIGEKWKDYDDPCVEYTCLREPSPKTNAFINERVQMCPSCAEDEKSMPPPFDQCCGICVRLGCALPDGSRRQIPIGEEIPDPEQPHCRNLTCKSHGFLVPTLVPKDNYKCPKTLFCDEDLQIPDAKTEGCCKKCKGSDRSMCGPVPLFGNRKESIGKVQVARADGVRCVNEDPIEVNECSGGCSSNEHFNFNTFTFEKRCECCRVETHKDVVVPLKCEDGSIEERIIKNPMTCKCNACS